MCLFGCNSNSGNETAQQGSRESTGNATPNAGTACTSCCPAFTINSRTVATQPATRTRKRLGIGEEVRLTTSPSTSVTWTIAGDDGQKGTLSSASGSSTTYTACDRAKTVTINAVSACGHSETIAFTVVGPASGRFGAHTDTSAITATTIRVGFQAPPAMMPNDVSFLNCDLREGTCPAATSGIFTRTPPPVHADTGAWVPFSATVGTDGTELSTHDTVQGTRPLTLFPAGGTTDGRFHWPIPWRTQVRGGGTNGALVFDTLDHELTYRASDRRMRMQKGNRGTQRTVP